MCKAQLAWQWILCLELNSVPKVLYLHCRCSRTSQNPQFEICVTHVVPLEMLCQGLHHVIMKVGMLLRKSRHKLAPVEDARESLVKDPGPRAQGPTPFQAGKGKIHSHSSFCCALALSWLEDVQRHWGEPLFCSVNWLNCLSYSIGLTQLPRNNV